MRKRGRGIRERGIETKGWSNPNEYLISAYLTPGKVQSDGMADSLPREWKSPVSLVLPGSLRDIG